MAFATEHYLNSIQQACPDFEPGIVPQVAAISMRAFCERLTPTAAHRIAIHLDDALAEAAQAGGRDPTFTGQPITLAEFDQLLIARTELDAASARRVIHTTAEALQPINDAALSHQWPAALHTLFAHPV